MLASLGILILCGSQFSYLERWQMITCSLQLFWEIVAIRISRRHVGVQERLSSLFSKSRGMPCLLRRWLRSCLPVIPCVNACCQLLGEDQQWVQWGGRRQLHLTLFSNTRATDKQKRTSYKKGRLYATYANQTAKDSGRRSRVMSLSTEANWEGTLSEIGQDLGKSPSPKSH